MHNYKIKIPCKSTIRIPTMQNDSRIVLIIATFKMNANYMISVLKGKTDKVKAKLTSDPRKAFAGIAIGSTLSIAGASLIYGDIEQFNASIKNSINAGIRSAMLYLPEMMADNIYAVEALKEMATNVDKEVLAGAGILSAGALYHTIKDKGMSDTGASIYHAIIDSFENSNIDTKRAKRGILYAGVLAAIGAGMATSGCLDFGGDDSTTNYIPRPDSIEPTHIEPETPVDVATPETVVVPVETPWYVERVGFDDAQVGTYSTLFDSDVDAVKTSMSGGSYDLFDTQTTQHILTHQEWDPSQIALCNDFSPDQYKALVDDYGSMKSLTMETYDLDGDGTMDKVAIHYVGSGGDEGNILEFETDIYTYDGGKIANAGPSFYIREHLKL